VGKEFNDLVMSDANKDTLLFIYSPTCPGCTGYTPIYEEIARKLSGISTLLVAKMDGTGNQVPHNDVVVANYPTLYLFKTEGRKKRVRSSQDPPRIIMLFLCHNSHPLPPYYSVHSHRQLILRHEKLRM
jgi:thiol-disulfide isomerase/thioredoxin